VARSGCDGSQTDRTSGDLFARIKAKLIGTLDPDEWVLPPKPEVAGGHTRLLSESSTRVRAFFIASHLHALGLDWRWLGKRFRFDFKFASREQAGFSAKSSRQTFSPIAQFLRSGGRKRNLDPAAQHADSMCHSVRCIERSWGGLALELLA
jgi:hypothetical protein